MTTTPIKNQWSILTLSISVSTRLVTLKVQIRNPVEDPDTPVIAHRPFPRIYELLDSVRTCARETLTP